MKEMKKRTPRTATAVAASLILALALLSSGCGLLISPKRDLKRRIHNFQVAIHKNEHRKAAGFFTSGARYFAYGAEEPARPTMFLRWAAGVSSRTAFYVVPKKISFPDKATAVVKARIQARSSDSSAMENVSWETNLTWEQDGKTWYIKEMRDITAKKHERS